MGRRISAPPTDSPLGSRCARARLRLGLTLTQLGERSGVSRVHCWQVESGRCVPTVAVLLRLCRALGVDPNTLLGWEESP